MPVRFSFSIFVLVVSVLAGHLLAQDWPRWGGSDACNMASAQKNIPAWFQPGQKKPDGSGIDLATTRNVKWAVKLGSQTIGTASVAGGRVFIGTNDYAPADPRHTSTKGGAVRCFNEANGQVLWQLIIPQKIIPRYDLRFDYMDLGVCSSPTVDGNRLYLVSNRCEVLCLDVNGTADGNQGPFVDEAQYQAAPGTWPVSPGPYDADIIWRYDMQAELNVWPHDAANCSVLVHGNMVYVGTSNGVDRGKTVRKAPSPYAPSLIVLDKHTGKLLAQDAEQIGTRVFHGQWSSPSLGDVNGRKLVFFGAGNGVCYAFDVLREAYPSLVSLYKVWQFDCNPPHYKLRNGQPIDYWEGDARFSKTNRNDGAYLGPSEIIGTPAFYKNRVYVAIGQDPLHGRGRGMLWCIDASKTGDISTTGAVWSFDKLDRTMSTVSIADGLLYIADWIGNLYCLDAETGRLYWTHECKAETWGSTLAADGKVYLGTKKSFWVLAAGREKKVLAEIRLGSPCWCNPIVANGVLFVSSDRYLWAIQGTHAPPSIVDRLTPQGASPEQSVRE